MSDPGDPRTWTLLARGAGEWEGPESMPPAPWAPEGVEARGRTSSRLVLGGRGLASEYEQTVGGDVTLRAHTLVHWDEEAGRFVMHFFSVPGGEPVVLGGRREDDALVFQGPGPDGPMRQRMQYGDGRVLVRTEAQGEDGAWVTTFRGEYAPVPEAPASGAVAWRDLTVEEAPALRDFYAAVVGWAPQGVSMGDYEDWNMVDAEGTPAAGICHARGANADLPPVWLPYVVVEDLDASLEEVRTRGGSLEGEVRSMGTSRMAVIRDPAGAALALWGPEGGG